MQSSNIPSKIPLPFAYAAGGGYVNPIPVASQIGVTDGRASLHDGFPPDTFLPIASGGVPPFGSDVNGILNEITAIQQWQQAGGFFPYDAAFSSAVGGYPLGAILQSSSFNGFWICIQENNTNNPDTSGTGWKPYFFSGLQSVTVTSTSQSLSNVQAAYSILKLSGTLTGNTNIIIPNYIASWVIANNTTGAYTLTVKTASGTGVTLTQNQSTYVYGDGTNIYFADSSKVASFNGRVGSVTLTSTDVTDALGFAPANALAIGSYYGVAQYNSGITIPSTDRGKLLVIGSSGGTFTLPAASTVPVGGTLSFQVQGGTLVLNRAGSDTISNGSTSNLTTITYSGNGFATFASNGTNGWIVASSSTLAVQSFNGRSGLVTLSSGDVTGALGFTPYNSTNPSNFVSASQFGYGFGQSSYQYLPTGMLIQFGVYDAQIGDGSPVTITFPVGFSSNAVSITALLRSNTPITGSSIQAMHGYILSTGQANFFVSDDGSVANAGFYWMAMGY